MSLQACPRARQDRAFSQASDGETHCSKVRSDEVHGRGTTLRSQAATGLTRLIPSPFLCARWASKGDEGFRPAIRSLREVS